MMVFPPVHHTTTFEPSEHRHKRIWNIKRRGEVGIHVPPLPHRHRVHHQQTCFQISAAAAPPAQVPPDLRKRQCSWRAPNSPASPTEISLQRPRTVGGVRQDTTQPDLYQITRHLPIRQSQVSHTVSQPCPRPTSHTRVQIMLSCVGNIEKEGYVSTNKHAAEKRCCCL